MTGVPEVVDLLGWCAAVAVVLAVAAVVTWFVTPPQDGPR